MPTGWRMDLTLAARMLVRHPALSTIAVFGITVGIALAATMFTIIGEQLNPYDLPLPQGERIVALQKWHPVKNQRQPIAMQDLLTWREHLSAVRDVGAYRTVTKNLIVPPAVPEPISIAEMSAAGFDVARTAPVIGRVIRPDDERAAAAPVVVIGHDEWRRRFGASPGVVNTTVQLGDTHHTIIGVMPEGFAFPFNHSYWIPLRLDAASHAPGGGSPLSVFARLADGATVASAHAELTVVADRTRATASKADEDVRARVLPYTHQFPEMDDPDNKFGMQLARFFVAILLVVISINIAVLVYARTAARHAEIAVRTALGASRGRIVAQLFGEGLVLAGLGAVAGVSIAAVALGQVRAALSQEGDLLPFWIRLDLSAETIMYIVALAVAAAALIGALPAWKATGPQVQHRLQALTAGGGAGMHLGRVWTALIILQVSFAVALLPMVVVRMSELLRDGTGQFGFAADEFLVAQLSLEQGTAQTGSADTVTRFATRYREMEQRIAAMTTVRASTFSSFAPGFEASTLVRSDIGSVDGSIDVNRVAPNFFDTYGVSILTGRNFTNADAAPGSRVVIVNRSFAELVGAAVLGSRIQLAEGNNGAQALTGLADDWYEVVGIVEDFPLPPSPPKVYRAITPDATQVLTMSLRLGAGDTEPWGARLPQMAADLDPTLQVTNVNRMGDLLSQQQRTIRLMAGVFAAMTLSVLLLSAAGIYAMTAFSVAQRRREIGIRLALGAGGKKILWATFSRVAAQLLAGAGLGTAVAVFVNRAISGGSISGDAAMAMLAVVLLMIFVGFLAALGPARQGLRIDPTEALRDPVR